MSEWLVIPGPALAIGIAAIGGLIAYRLRLPGGSLIGALALTAVAGLTIFQFGSLGTTYQTIAQIVLGAALGSAFDRKMIGRFARVGGAAALVTGITIAVGLGGGLALTRFATIDQTSAMLSGAPGGAGEMAAVGLALGGDVRLIAGVHFVRQIGIIVLAPILLRLLLSRKLVLRALGQE